MRTDLDVHSELLEARRLIELTSTFLGVVDVDGRVRELNPFALDSLGISRADLGVCPLWESEVWKFGVQEAVEGRASVFELDLPGSEPPFRRFRFSITPIRAERESSGGTIRSLALVGEEVTDRLAMQHSISGMQRQLTDVIENMSDAFFSLDKNWTITRVNAQHERIVKMPRERQIGRNLLDLFFDYPGARETLYWIYYHRAMIDRVPVYFEDHYPALNIWTAVSAYPQGDGGLTVFFREISDLKRSESELRQAIQARDTFLGIASHELKTPLTSLRLHSQMSRRLFDKHGYEAFSRERILKLIEQPITQSERLIRLVDDMLDVSRIASGRLTMNFEPTDLSALVQATVERFAPQLEAAGCEVSIDVEPGIQCEVDGFRFEQVLTNLITNVMKYAPKAPVSVSLAKDPDGLRLQVRDSGSGIPEDKLKSVFHRFERVGSADHVSGLGLGLYISKEIVESHGGMIHVTSDLGVGSVFTIRLPLVRDFEKGETTAGTH